MNRDISILVVGATGGSVAEGVLKCLRLANYTNVQLLEHHPDAAHRYRISKCHIVDSNPDHEKYVAEILALCGRKKIKIIVPGSTWEALCFSKNLERLKRAGVHALVNSFKVIAAFNDKWTTYQLLKKKGFPVLKTWLNRSNLEGLQFPVVIKPTVGRGSRDVFTTFKESECRAIVSYLKARKIPFVIQEHVGTRDQEYTVGVVSDIKGSVLDSIVMQQYLGGGHTDHAKICKRSSLNDFCEKVASAMGSVGPMNLQLRLDPHGIPFIFEINPRFSGSAPMRALAGFNEPDAVLRSFVFREKLAKLPVKESLEFFRVFQEIYIDRSEEPLTGRLKHYI